MTLFHWLKYLHCSLRKKNNRPRRFFSSWIQKPRKRYCQWLTWGHAIRKQMDRVRLDRKQWSIQARDLRAEAGRGAAVRRYERACSCVATSEYMYMMSTL